MLGFSTRKEKRPFELSHDEWLEVRADEDETRKEFAAGLEKYGIPLLAR